MYSRTVLVAEIVNVRRARISGVNSLGQQSGFPLFSLIKETEGCSGGKTYVFILAREFPFDLGARGKENTMYSVIHMVTSSWAGLRVLFGAASKLKNNNNN